MTDKLEFQELRDALVKATKRDWKADGDTIKLPKCIFPVPTDEETNNVAFIVSAKNTLPALLAAFDARTEALSEFACTCEYLCAEFHSEHGCLNYRARAALASPLTEEKKDG